MTSTGAPLVLLDLYDYFRGQGYNVEFISRIGGTMSTYFAANKLPYHVMGPRNVSVIQDLERYDYILANTIVVDDWIDAQVVYHGQEFLNKLIWYIHELPVSQIGIDQYLKPARHRKLMLLLSCRAAIFISHAVHESYLREMEVYLDIGKHKLGRNHVVIHNAIPKGVPGKALDACGRKGEAWTEYEELRNQNRQKINATKDDYVIAHIGQISHYKGSDDLIKAFVSAASRRQIPAGKTSKIFLVLIGTTTREMNPIVREAIAQQRGYKIVTPGAFADFNRMMGWYAAADVAAFNPQCEAFGRVFLEAMAFSAPVLATKCGGPLEIMQDGTSGLLHESVDELAANILKLDVATETGRRLGRDIGKAGCLRAKKMFSREKYFRAMHALMP